MPRCSRYTFFLLCFCLLFAASSARAQSQPVGTVDQLDAIKTQNTLLEAQISNAKLQKEYKSEQGSGSAPTPGPVVLPGLGLSFNEPAVVSIIGISGRPIKATIRLSNGHTLGVLRGDKIPGTPYTVSSITGKGVQVRDLKEETAEPQYLPFIGSVAPGSQKNDSMPIVPVIKAGPDSTSSQLKK